MLPVADAPPNTQASIEQNATVFSPTPPLPPPATTPPLLSPTPQNVSSAMFIPSGIQDHELPGGSPQPTSPIGFPGFQDHELPGGSKTPTYPPSSRALGHELPRRSTASPQLPPKRFCAECGFLVSQTDMFCVNCGFAVRVFSKEFSPSVVPPFPQTAAAAGMLPEMFLDLGAPVEEGEAYREGDASSSDSNEFLNAATTPIQQAACASAPLVQAARLPRTLKFQTGLGASPQKILFINTEISTSWSYRLCHLLLAQKEASTSLLPQMYRLSTCLAAIF